ncbi:Small secreted domain, partial [Streptomyces sp. Termitarium-T10T-6]
MRQVTRKGLITMAAAGGVLALSGGYAHADSGAASTASGSPGVLSGNSVQVPIDIPVNVCGNSVSVGGLLNPASGNDCGNGSAGSDRSAQSDRSDRSG